ncbi:MAG: hypothetical protein ACP5E5_07555 [Acidobacteriaceae bacterium]
MNRRCNQGPITVPLSSEKRDERKSSESSEWDHGDAGDGLEVAYVAGGNTVANIECRDGYEQVGVRQRNAPGRALSVDLPGPESD